MDLTIVPLTTMEEAEGVVDVQRHAWQMSDLGIVPTFETKAVSDAGFVYVAKDDGEIIGFIYGYHHFPDIHYSHMMAVLPQYQGQGVGFALKKYHRKQALASDHHVRIVQWTVDPLLPNNAYLNFTKLGGYCDVYKVNYYGDPDSDGVDIYAGVPTDRFLLKWPIHTDRVEKRMKNYQQERISYNTLLSRSPAINTIKELKFSGNDNIPTSNFSVEVPGNYQQIRVKNLDIAREWRVIFRNICTEALSRNFVIADYHHVSDKGQSRNYYEFIRKSEIELALGL